MGVALIVRTSTFCLQLLEALLVSHPEALLFVDHQQAQIPELHVLREQAVRADDYVDFALGQILRNSALISFAVRKRLSISMRTGKAAKPALEGLEVLKGEHRGGRQHGNLLAVAQALNAARMATSVLP